MTKRIFGTLALTLIAAQGFAQSSGQSSVIKEILIRGNKRVLSEAIQAVMRTKTGQPYIQDNLDKDKQAIEDLGYFSKVDVLAAPQEAGNYTVYVEVAEFPVVKEIRVTGNKSVKTEEILAAATLKPGQVYNLKEQRKTNEAVGALYAKKGLYAQVEEFRPLDDSPGTINLAVLELVVGKVGVHGQSRTKDWVFQRLIKTKSGEAFNGNKWTDDLRRLYNTGWFEPGSLKSVEDTERELGKIDLTVDLKETRTGTFNIGLQLDPQSSLAGVIKLTESNLYGTGKSVGVDFVQTTRGGGASLSLDYSNPFYDAKNTVFNASIYSRLIYRFSGSFGGTSFGNTNYQERRTGVSMGFSRVVKDKLSLGVTARYEGVGTGDVPKITNDNGTPLDPSDDYLSADPNFIQQDGSLGVVSFGATLNRRDLDLDPSRGDYMRFDLEPGFSRITKASGVPGQDILGSNMFVRTTLEYRRYWSPQPARTRQEPDAPRKVLALRVRGGLITGKVPFFEQYFAGGSDSIRGYDEDRFWGKQTLLGTLEYRYPIQRSFNAIAFVDAGGAWGGYGTVNNFNQSNKFDMHVGYGLGLSFRTPLGPIRLDLGFDSRGKSRTHFLIGTSF